MNKIKGRRGISAVFLATIVLFVLMAMSISINAQLPPEVKWDKTFGGSVIDYASSVQQTTDGGYILAGRTSSFGAGSGDAWLIKTDPNGDKLWDKTFGGLYADNIYSVQQTTDGGYILAGRTYSFGAGSSDAWLIALSSEEFIKLSLIPDSTVISRGDTLGIEVNVTNYTNEVKMVFFVTNVNLPGGDPYPPSGYLFGPIRITLNPYESRSGHISSTIPLFAPLGTYNYNGYVGTPEEGIIAEDHFDFEVIEGPMVGPKKWETIMIEEFN